MPESRINSVFHALAGESSSSELQEPASPNSSALLLSHPPMVICRIELRAACPRTLPLAATPASHRDPPPAARTSRDAWRSTAQTRSGMWSATGRRGDADAPRGWRAAPSAARARRARGAGSSRRRARGSPRPRAGGETAAARTSPSTRLRPRPRALHPPLPGAAGGPAGTCARTSAHGRRLLLPPRPPRKAHPCWGAPAHHQPQRPALWAPPSSRLSCCLRSRAAVFSATACTDAPCV